MMRLIVALLAVLLLSACNQPTPPPMLPTEAPVAEPPAQPEQQEQDVVVQMATLTPEVGITIEIIGTPLGVTVVPLRVTQPPQATLTPEATDVARLAYAQLRITNASEFVLDEVVLRFPNEEITFGPIGVGETTSYQPAQMGVYRYAAYKVALNGNVINQPVMDFLGERPLGGEAFTYILSIDPEQPNGEKIQAEVIIETLE